MTYHESGGFLRDDPPAGASVGALVVTGIAGGGGGAGDASAANQATQIGLETTTRDNVITAVARLEAIRDRLPPALDADGGLMVHVQNTVPVSGPLTDAQLRAAAVPVSGTFFQATQPVSLATNTPDVTDRAARLLGHVTVDNASLAVTGPLTDTQLRASAVPVSMATQTPDVTDRDARLLGRAKILDSTGTVIDPATKGQLPAALVGGRLSVDASGVAVPVTDNAGSLTVDAPVGTPVFTRLSDGATALIGQKVMASSLPVALASDQSALAVSGPLTDTQLRASAVPVDVSDRIARLLGHVIVDAGDVDHDAVNTLKQVQIGGNARAVDDPDTNVSATGDRVRAWMDRKGAMVVRRRKIRESYTAVFRLAETAARLDQTFTLTANTNKQYATLHHAASATKELQLQAVRVWITLAGTAVFQGVVELRELSSATPPATGNPAITGRPHRIGTGAHEATALYLPTTQGSEAAANSPLGHLAFDLGIEAAATSTANPLPGGADGPAAYTLFDASRQDDQVMAPTAPVGVYGGWAIVFRSTAATVLRVTALMTFTEEIP